MRRSLLMLVAVGVLGAAFVVEPSAGARSGVAVTLKNTGDTPITDMTTAFDNLPYDDDPGGDFRIGDLGADTNVGFFHYGGSPISRVNPLPPGGVACTGAIREFTKDTRLLFYQWTNEPYRTAATYVRILVVPDVTVYSFADGYTLADGTHVTTAGDIYFNSASRRKSRC